MKRQGRLTTLQAELLRIEVLTRNICKQIADIKHDLTPELSEDAITRIEKLFTPSSHGITKINNKYYKQTLEEMLEAIEQDELKEQEDR